MRGHKAGSRFVGWTDARVDILLTEWRKGTTATRIAAVLGGTSRNAVIGKAHRMGLMSRESPIKKIPATARPKPVIVEAPREISAGMSKWQREFFTQERIRIIRAGYNAATVKSIGEISLTVGCSTASVARYAKEQGWTHPHSSHSSRLSASERAAKFGQGHKPPQLRSERLAARAPITAPDSRRVTLADLDRGQCHFPTSPHMAGPGQHRFCGAEVERNPDGSQQIYCAFHHHVATRPLVAPEEREADNNAARMAAE